MAGLGGMTMTGDPPPLSVAGGTLKLEVCAEDVIRVAFATNPSFFTRTSLATAPKRCDATTPWELSEESGAEVLRTSRIELQVDTSTGRIAFFDRAGNLVVTEKADGGRTLEPATVQSETTNHVRQEWEPNDGEALYGLGNYQLGLLDIKGYDLELSQYNTNAVVPTLVSSRGYGIYWDNTSYTRFGDLRDYEKVPGVTYDSSSNVNGASSGSVDTTVQVTPASTGDYIFKTYASGDVKLTIDGTRVIDHWRQGWLPDEEVARVHLTGGKAVSVRLQWTADGSVDTLALSWKQPSAAPATTSLWSEVGDGIDYYYMFGPDLDRVIAGYRRVTGQASLMPRWAFGLFQSREHYQSADEPAKWHVEINRVRDARAFALFDEGVRVHPRAVGPAALLVDEALGRLPARDLGLPSQRDPVEAQAVVNPHAGPQHDAGREDLEVQPGRRQRLEVSGVGKELKDFVPRPRQPDVARETHAPS